MRPVLQANAALDVLAVGLVFNQTGVDARLGAFTFGLLLFGANLLLMIYVGRRIFDGAGGRATARQGRLNPWLTLALFLKVMVLGGGAWLALRIADLDPLFFLAGLVIHGGLQAWWIEPVLGRLEEIPLFIGATLLTSINDTALITYLATLVPGFGPELRLAVVEGAVVGGGLTVIANAPNPAGQALLGRFFNGAISPASLALGALGPTLVAAIIFRLL